MKEKLFLIGSGPLIAQEIFCVDSNLAVKKFISLINLKSTARIYRLGKVCLFFHALNKDKIQAFFYAPKKSAKFV